MRQSSFSTPKQKPFPVYEIGAFKNSFKLGALPYYFGTHYIDKLLAIMRTGSCFDNRSHQYAATPDAATSDESADLFKARGMMPDVLAGKPRIDASAM